MRCFFLALILSPLIAFGAHLGVRLPKGSKSIAQHRFESPLSFERTLRFMKKKLRGVRFKVVVDLPDVVVAHADAPHKKYRWKGINISFYGGSTKIFFISRD